MVAIVWWSDEIWERRKLSASPFGVSGLRVDGTSDAFLKKRVRFSAGWGSVAALIVVSFLSIERSIRQSRRLWRK